VNNHLNSSPDFKQQVLKGNVSPNKFKTPEQIYDTALHNQETGKKSFMKDPTAQLNK
jgi:hypothetical protein